MITPLAPDQKKQAAAVLTHAFEHDPIYGNLFPNANERQRALSALWSALITYNLRYGEVYTTPEVYGVASWIRPGQTDTTLWRHLRTGMALPRAVMKFKSKPRQRFLRVLSFLDDLHKQAIQQPHWYLWALGVAPDHQGQGIGRKLIQPVFDHADKTGLACYLETETESNVAFYQRRGFEVVFDGVCPKEELRVWTMLRRPTSCKTITKKQYRDNSILLQF
jgi:ribosomal protein S18 acetylase RimI-like enzyme